MENSQREDTTFLCECREGSEPIITASGERVCTKCGMVLSGGQILQPPSYLGTAKDEGGERRDYRNAHQFAASRFRSMVCKGIPEGTHYERRFHWNERLSQMDLNDPNIPEDIWLEIFQESKKPEYRKIGFYTRGTVIQIIKNLEKKYKTGFFCTSEGIFRRFITYRERWKNIQYRLNGRALMLTTQSVVTHQVLKQIMQDIHEEWKNLNIPLRKNFWPFNYFFRKILDHLGVFDFHWELPPLISVKKIKTLDLYTEIIFSRLHLKFFHSVLIKRPKLQTLYNVVFIY